MNVARVKDRTSKGGHNVPEDKIRERCYKSIANLRPAALKADKIFVFDNTTSFDPICTVDKLNGELNISDRYPSWLAEYFDPNELR